MNATEMILFSDEARELWIAALIAEAAVSTDPARRCWLVRVVSEEIGRRSAEQIQRMEQERGLA